MSRTGALIVRRPLRLAESGLRGFPNCRYVVLRIEALPGEADGRVMRAHSSPIWASDGSELGGAPEQLPEGLRVICWRLTGLAEAGYSADTAAAIAIRSEIDLHTAVDLVARGCPYDTAVRILL